MQNDLIRKDLQYIWHPCSQMKDYEDFQPLQVERAHGSYLHLTDGRKVIDAISSWWCKSLGHCHPRLQQALLRQLQRFEHVISTNTTNETIVKLSQKLCSLMPSLTKVFYAGDGSCALEIALKMSLHSRKIRGEFKKTKFIALQNGYHGETIGAMSVSDLGIYKHAYKDLIFSVDFIQSLPYVNHINDPLWFDCEQHWQKIKNTISIYAEQATALVLEPIVQGAGGMRIYSQDFLKRLRQWTTENNIHLIADEIMTGIGRTGKMLACEYANIEPDFLCLAKGLSAGWVPFSAVLTTNEMYQNFYADYATGKSFLHSHTYSGHVLGASIALEVLAIIAEENLCARAIQIGKTMYCKMLAIAKETQRIINVRHIGAIVAADIVSEDKNRRMGFEVFKNAMKLGAFLRPLDNTIYWLPPLTIETVTLEKLADITKRALIEL